jgi:hypothetical protein
MGHFDIQEIDIDRVFLGNVEDLYAVDGFVDDRDVFLALLDDRPEAGPDDGVIIRQDNPDAHDRLPPMDRKPLKNGRLIGSNCRPGGIGIKRVSTPGHNLKIKG